MGPSSVSPLTRRAPVLLSPLPTAGVARRRPVGGAEVGAAEAPADRGSPVAAEVGPQGPRRVRDRLPHAVVHAGDGRWAAAVHDGRSGRGKSLLFDSGPFETRVPRTLLPHPTQTPTPDRGRHKDLRWVIGLGGSVWVWTEGLVLSQPCIMDKHLSCLQFPFALDGWFLRK